MARTLLLYSWAFPSRPPEFSAAPLTMAPPAPALLVLQTWNWAGVSIKAHALRTPFDSVSCIALSSCCLFLPNPMPGSCFVCLCLIVCIGESLCRFVHVRASACQGEKWWLPSPRTGVMQVVVSLLTWEWEPILRPLEEQEMLLTAEPYLQSLGAVVWESTYYRERNSPKTPVYSRTFCTGLLFVSMLFYYIIFYFIGPTF